MAGRTAPPSSPPATRTLARDLEPSADPAEAAAARVVPAAEPDPAAAPGQAAVPAEVADELGCQLSRLMRLVGRAAAQLAARRTDGIERAAHVLLAHLVREGPQRTTDLAEAVHSDPSTVSRQVGALVQQGLVERRPDPKDGRACLLAATAEGQKVFDEHRGTWNAYLLRLLATWPPGEIRRLASLLDRFNSDFEKFRMPLGDEPVREGDSQ
ncbi:MarR family winged helix-turn-helix transcriptional regulator [Gandjariella thermophila]|uniref:MarR family winged helix-turn-helix transcriptional regulator n=1 Tax=Gandjariella thermophila TaxID=1931992 RepID=UPI001CEFAB84|nr:MarR family winged helix-turn-helix transcriptional regulator [Gandjariella thermophila]